MTNDLTRGTIWKQLLLFTLPILGGSLLQLMYSTVDGIVVGNFVSAVALGSISTSLSTAGVLVAVSTGLSTGLGIVIAQFFGARKHEDMQKGIATGYILLVGTGLVLTVAGWVFSPVFLRAVMRVPDDAMAYAVTYLRIYFLGMCFQFLYNAYAAALRAVGDSRATLLFLVIAAVINIILDLLFVIAFKWDVAGVAAATVIAQGVAAAAGAVYIKKRRPEIHIARSALRFDRPSCALILKMGVPVMLQSIVSSLGAMAINRLINSFGSTVMSGVAAGSRVEQFAVIPAVAFNAGVSTFAGQNMGAGNMARIKKGYVTALCMGAAMNIVLGGVLLIFARPLVALFGCEGAALETGTMQLTFMAKVLVLLMVLFTTRGMLQGVGDVSVTTVITILTLAFRIFIAYYMAGVDSIGYRAIWYSMGIDFSLGTCLYMVRLATGRWKGKAIAKAPSSLLEKREEAKENR